MATANSTGGAQAFNYVTSGTTVTNTRGINAITTAAGTNLAIVKMKVSYRKRIAHEGNRFLLFLADKPKYLPNVGQKVLVHYTDVADDSALEQLLTTRSSNVSVGSFVRLAIMGDRATPVGARDGFNYALDINFDIDDQVSYANGSCSGLIEYDISPLNYDILKPIESNVVVTEHVPFDNSDGKKILFGTSTGDTQNIGNVCPMLFTQKADVDSIFSNLYKSFNLPTTDSELKEFTQSPLGAWTDSTAGDMYYKNKKGYWTQNAVGATPLLTDIVHPVTGHTGSFYQTVYAPLVTDEVLVMEIPQGQYGEIVDGKTLKITLPKTGSGYYSIFGAYQKNTAEYDLGKMDNYMSEHNLSASFFGAPPILTDPAYESNVVLLFSDDIVGYEPQTVSGGSWKTGHDEVIQGEKVYNPKSIVKKQFFDFYEDKAVGIAYLDKGFVVITEPTMVAAIKTRYQGANDPPTYDNARIAANIIVTKGEDAPFAIDRQNSQFLFAPAGADSVAMEFLSYNTEKSINIVCLASPNEFYRTTNETAKVLDSATDKDYAEFKNPISGNLYPVIITEVGLHDQYGNLLAIAKPIEPIKKYWYDVVAMNIKIRI